MENASHLHGWGGHPTAVKGLAEVRTHGVKMLGRVGFGRQCTAVHGRLAGITELKAPVDARSGNKKRLGPQGNDHRLAES
jgi:hypothetical protein